MFGAYGSGSFLSGLIFLVLDPATRASCFRLVEHIVSAFIMFALSLVSFTLSVHLLHLFSV